MPTEPSGHGPGGAAACADVEDDREHTLRNMLCLWTALDMPPERNTFEDHPEGFSLEWLIKKLS